MCCASLARIMHECFATVRSRCVVARKATEALGDGPKLLETCDPLNATSGPLCGSRASCGCTRSEALRESAKRMAAEGGHLTLARRGSNVLWWKTRALSGLVVGS